MKKKTCAQSRWPMRVQKIAGCQKVTECKQKNCIIILFYMLSQLIEDLEPSYLFAALNSASNGEDLSCIKRFCTFFPLCIHVLDVALPFCTAGDPILPLYLLTTIFLLRQAGYGSEPSSGPITGNLFLVFCVSTISRVATKDVNILKAGRCVLSSIS